MRSPTLTEELDTLAHELGFGMETETGDDLFCIWITAPEGKVWASTGTPRYSASDDQDDAEGRAEVRRALIRFVHESIGRSHDRSAFSLPAPEAGAPIPGDRVKQLLHILSTAADAAGYSGDELLAVNIAMAESRFIQLLAQPRIPESVEEDMMMIAGALQVEFQRIVHRRPMTDHIDPEAVTAHIVKAIARVRELVGKS